jgi:hypothetical protein
VHDPECFRGDIADRRHRSPEGLFALRRYFHGKVRTTRSRAERRARELAPKGIDVAHFVIDGVVRTANATELRENMLSPDAIAWTSGLCSCNRGKLGLLNSSFARLEAL